MPLRVSLKKHFFSRSERVKAVDFHPTEPFLLSALYDGRLQIHDYTTHALVKEIDASPLPLRTAKFIVKRQWMICGGDDCALRVFNIHTLEKVKEISNAHGDYIRHVSVHSSKPLVLSSSDDMTIKLWNYEKNWQRMASYEQHSHYVMQTQWHPRDPNLFASCSLDRTIKVWGLQARSASPASTGSVAVVSAPHFTLTGHERGVNCIEYSKSGERPYIVSGSDDCTVRVWDYQTKQCIQVLTGHSRNVCAVTFTALAGHVLPLLFSAGEDAQLFVWHALTYKKELSLDLNVERIWSLSLLDSSGTSASAGAGGGPAAGGPSPGAAAGVGGSGGLGGLVLAIGSDSGTLVLKMGKEQPVASLHSGKAVVARGFEVLQVNLRLLEDQQYQDGERLPVAYKELGQCEIFPQNISHHPNGRFIAVCGDGEYVIYTAQALRNKTFGKCVDFVWSAEGHYAIREESNRIRIYTNFAETFNFAPPFAVETLWGGALLALKAGDDSFVCFYDWEAGRLIRRIDVLGVQQVHWSPSGFFVALFTPDKIYVLRHDKFAVMAANAAQAREEEGGIEIAFELVDQISETALSGLWVSECLVYTTPQGRVKCWCGSQVETLHHNAGGRSAFLLGYVPEQNRLYFIDRDLGLSACGLHVSFIEYKVAIARNDIQAAQEFLPRIPVELHDRAARFLFSRGYAEDALKLARDEQLRFDVALSLGNLAMCADLVRASSKTVVEQGVLVARWKRLGDVALETGNLQLAATCFHECHDYHSLLLLYSASGDAGRLLDVASAAVAAKNFTVAFLAYALTQRLDACVDVLCASERFPEAAFFARSYAPSRASDCVQKWRESLMKKQSRREKKDVQKDCEQGGDGYASKRSPADPAQQPEKFEGLEDAVEAEKVLRERYARVTPAAAFPSMRRFLDYDIVQQINQEGLQKVRSDLFSASLDDLLDGAASEHVEAPSDLLDAAPSADGETVPPGKELPVNGTTPTEAYVPAFDPSSTGVPVELHRVPHSFDAGGALTSAASPSLHVAGASELPTGQGSASAYSYLEPSGFGVGVPLAAESLPVGGLAPSINRAGARASANGAQGEVPAGSSSAAYSPDVRSTVTEPSAYTGASSLEGLSAGGGAGAWSAGCGEGDFVLAPSGAPEVSGDARTDAYAGTEPTRAHFAGMDKRLDLHGADQGEARSAASGFHFPERKEHQSELGGRAPSPHAAEQLADEAPPAPSAGVHGFGGVGAVTYGAPYGGCEGDARGAGGAAAALGHYAYAPASPKLAGAVGEPHALEPRFDLQPDAGAQFLQDEFVDVADSVEPHRAPAGGGSDISFSDIEA
ncbi:putative COPI protein [Besnoitia besnoiti]|uniref:Beta'-coat protein n=1 Tax=Besnoitia besnoiti TaxID=94643 RepID=A0A2A9MD23_BESBE|nr:putative COPI protein [Besnoitia besnoiti]PFH35779.1 putative COPI protein [Besnoitia besnoiti]